MAPDISIDIQTYIYCTSCHTTTDIQFPMCIMAPDIFLPVSQTSRHTDLLLCHTTTEEDIRFPMCHTAPDIFCPVSQTSRHTYISPVSHYSRHPDSCVSDLQMYNYFFHKLQTNRLCVTNIKHVYSTSKRFLNRYSVLSVSNCLRQLHFLCPEEEERYFPYAAQNTFFF
jgi:hypothetical protein